MIYTELLDRRTFCFVLYLMYCTIVVAMFTISKGLLCSAGLVAARDIIFPPIADYQHALGQSGSTPEFSSDLDISSALFSGLTTYANLPYVHCLASEGEVERYDIAIVGAPFDTVGRPGARFGPNGIRQGSRRIVSDAAWGVYDGRNYFKEGVKVVDCGDAPLTFLVISGRRTNNTDYHVPRIITLGGDHTTTLPALRSTFGHYGAVSVIHFDSHIDTWDPEILGGGIRAPVINKKYDLAHDKACGFHIITARDLDKIGTQGIIDKLKARTSGTKVYISVDIDVLDPAFAPATGTAEVGGWTTRELLTILDGLVGLEIVGGDVVEVAPIYDNPGETTVLAAAEVVHSLIGLMTAKPVRPKAQE
nr:putative agmatinase 1 [Quercus suber]